MAEIAPSKFTYYELTLDEQKDGEALTLNQMYVLQNERANCADILVELSCNAEGLTPEEAQRRRAYYKGMLDAFTWMLDKGNPLHPIEDENEEF